LNPVVFLEGDRIVLSPLRREDYELHYQRWMHDREVTRYLVRGTFPQGTEQMGRLYEEMSASPVDLELCVIDKDTGAPLGVAGLHAIQWIARSAEFRILLGEKQAWGRGIGGEVLQLLVAYGMEMLNLEKVWLGVSTANERAYRSYRRTGFVEEGTLRNELYRNGRYYDVCRMSLLRDEYLTLVEQWPLYPRIRTQLRASA